MLKKYIFQQVKEAESRLRHKLLPPNAWMRVHNFDVLTSCPKDELHQWFIGLYREYIIPAISYGPFTGSISSTGTRQLCNDQI